jgi:protein O-mannosyl-transferase
LSTVAPAIVEVRRPENPFSDVKRRTFILSLLLVLLTLLTYNVVAHNGFINIDDNGYVIDNQHVHAGLSWNTVKWAFTTFDCENWHPLTWLSHALDWQLFGIHAAGHHYVSALFHALNAVLLFWLLQSATGSSWKSLIVAALFAVHPVNVESVAWAAERKNVLSMFFFLLCMLAYGWYAQRPSVRRYSAVFLLFACGLMAKPQVITLPFVLLLWDYWPLYRLKSSDYNGIPTRFAKASVGWLILEKIPLLALSAADALITMRAQKKAVNYAITYGLPARIENAVVAYARYVGHAFWPFSLSPTYPHPGQLIAGWQVATSLLFLVAVTAAVMLSGKRYLQVGWCWFLGILVPMIGIIQVGDQAMADRYAYIPFIALFWMATWGGAELVERFHVSAYRVAAVACAIVALCSALTYRQVTHWRDGETLWKYALKVKPDDFMAHSYLAALLTIENRHDEAISEYLAAEKLHNYPIVQIAMFADYELRHDHLSDAVWHAQHVLQVTDDKQSRELAFRDLGIANTKLAKMSEAQEDYENALQLDPSDPIVLIGMGVLSYRQNEYAKAADYFSRFVSVEPTDVGYCSLGTSLEKTGRKAEAEIAYAEARRLSKDWGQTQSNTQSFLAN